MADLDTLRGQLIEELWLPVVKEAGKHFYGRRKNKRMRLFTLTDGVLFGELIRFEGEGLIQRGDAVLWVSNMIKAVRAETESRGSVYSGSICDEEVLGTVCPLRSLFPCDILNLDFSSQDYNSNNQRIEKEIGKTEQFLCLQNQKRNPGFVVLQSTVIDAEVLDRDAIKNFSDSMHENDWGGLTIDGFPQLVADNGQKRNFIKQVLQSLGQKYKYRALKITDAVKIIDANQQLISIAGIFTR